MGRPRILIAPNAFKGSLSCLEAARSIARGVRDALPRSEPVLLPIADGGDGLIDAVLEAKGGTRLSAAVRGPLGEKRRAVYGWTAGKTAIIEMARASGLALVPLGTRDALKATSFGTGQLIDAALRRGARGVVVGLGGSASNDGGAGMAQALGVRLQDESGRELAAGAEPLRRLTRIDASALARRLRGVKVVAVSDVVNPLLGPQGSARVYGPQKGASPEDVRVIERALTRYAAAIKTDLGSEVAGVPGAGAAGGLGAGLLAFLGARIVPGAEWVLDAIGLDRQLGCVDAALTGEGRFDSTDFFGKGPIAVVRRARRAGVPVGLVCAEIETGCRSRLAAEGATAAISFREAGATAQDSESRARTWARKAAALAVAGLGLAALLVAPARSAAPEALEAADALYYNRDREGNLEASIERCERLLELRSDDPAALWRLGRGLVRLGERVEGKRERLSFFQRAERELARSTELDPRAADAHFWRGVALGRIGQARGMLKSLFLVDDIRDEMHRAIALDPAHAGAHHVLGELLWQVPGFAGGDKKRALAEFEKAAELAPNYTANLVPLAEAYLRLGREDDARRALRAVLEVKRPSDPAEYPKNAAEAKRLLERLGGATP